MNRYYYDLHLHSCLSPCADNDNTPNNLAGVGVLAGLHIMALTDHNTTKNCPAFFAAAKKQGIIPIAGMELTTAEDIHVICLFEQLCDAMQFDAAIETRRVLIKNRTDIFGDQLIMNDLDEVIGQEEFLLSNATTVPLDECPALVENFGGICYPAHIDRQSNGVVAVLGTFPSWLPFTCAEFHDKEKIGEMSETYDLKNLQTVVCSDAHYLWDVRDKEHYFELPVKASSGDLVRAALFRRLRGL